MGLLTILNYVASFLLLVSFILLLVTTISAPTVNSLALLRVKTAGDEHVNFGTFGYCVIRSGADACTGADVGYNAGGFLNAFIGANFGSGSRGTIRVLTRAMILHPLACVLAFFAFAASAASSVCGAIVAMMLAMSTFLLTIIAMACDFAWARLIRSRVNDNNFQGSTAEYRECIWFVLVSALFTLIASMLLLVSCCSSRNRNREKTTTSGRRRFF